MRAAPTEPATGVSRRMAHCGLLGTAKLVRASGLPVSAASDAPHLGRARARARTRSVTSCCGRRPRRWRPWASTWCWTPTPAARPPCCPRCGPNSSPNPYPTYACRTGSLSRPALPSAGRGRTSCWTGAVPLPRAGAAARRPASADGARRRARLCLRRCKLPAVLEQCLAWRLRQQLLVRIASAGSTCCRATPVRA